MAFPESLRDPLPKSEIYPVGRESLDAALTDAGVEHLDQLDGAVRSFCERRRKARWIAKGSGLAGG